MCDVLCDIICSVQAQGTKTYAGRHNSGRYHHFTGRERLDVHLLKPSRLEVVQEQLQDVQCDADIADQTRWIECKHRTSHPIIRWLPSKHIETTFFSKLYHFFLQKTTFFSKPNSALFDRSHCSRMRSETMCLWRRDWMFAPTIRYQFKRHLFTRRPCTGPHLWAGPEGDCNCWDTGIEISFNFSRSRQFAFVRNACGH